jgi:predicted ArsR family transcriptional regulator
MEKLLWWLIVGTKGGINRAKIIRILHDRPHNANQLAGKLKVDYKTIRHHIEVLEKNSIVSPYIVHGE